MKEKRFIKLKTDMYSDTKFKIIDTMKERDLINCIWTRLLALCGRLGSAGELYLSRNIPYTVETLALEFNRSAEEVKLALDVFIDLEMVELTENTVYVIKNFAKHQSIKVDKLLQEDSSKKSKDSFTFENSIKAVEEEEQSCECEKDFQGVKEEQEVLEESNIEDDKCEYVSDIDEDCPCEEEDVEGFVEDISSFEGEDYGQNGDLDLEVDGFQDTSVEEYNDEDINGFDVDRDVGEERVVKTLCFFGTQ